MSTLEGVAILDDPAGERRSRSPLRTIVPLALGLVLLGVVFRSVDLTRVLAVFETARPWLVVALLTYALPVLGDAAGWRVVLRALGQRLRLKEVFTARLAVEWMQLS